MNRTVRVFVTAKADADRIYKWLVRRSPQGARLWFDALLDSYAKIEGDPEAYAVVAETRPRWRREIFQSFFGTKRGRRYRVVFELTQDEVRILRVRGPSQRPLRRRDLPEE